MNSQSSDKKIEEILNQLNKVLDELTKKEKPEVGSTEPGVQQEQEVVLSKKEEVEVKPEGKSLDDTQQQEVHAGMAPSAQTVQDITTETEKQISEKKVTQETTQLSVTQSETKPAETEQQQSLVINSIIFYPAADNESKDVFINSLNSTLERVSKNKVRIEVQQNIAYSSLREDILDNTLLKLGPVKIIFIIINEITTETDLVVNRLSSFAETVKIVLHRDLKLRSMYLDLAIDLLLSTK